jgi:SAM-dependent methyltransferase
MKRITECRVCGDKNIKGFFDLGDQPFANSLLKSADEKENSYPLSLSWCPTCNLVQLNHTADPKELFSSYVWVTATSKTAHEHADNFYNEVMKRVKSLNQSYVLEVASNDGTFLLPFIHDKYKVLGVDPAKNIAEIAEKNGVPTIADFFGLRLAKQILKTHGKAKIVFARNVIPHVANLHDVIKGMAMCLDDDGLMIIEAHYAKIILEGLHYDSIYHEHLCYFTLKSMEHLLSLYNLNVIDITPSPISGGSMVLYIKKQKEGKAQKEKQKIDESESLKEYRQEEKQSKVNDLKSWKDFALRAYKHKHQLLKILDDIVAKEGPIVGYGASARSSTMLNFCGIDHKLLCLIADQNPLKQELYTAGTHILILSPEEVMRRNPKTVLILAWNFSQEIMDGLKKNFRFEGRCILPLPNDPRVVRLKK